MTLVVLLAAITIAVPLSRELGLGSVLGYLAAGIAIGPFGLQLVTEFAPRRGQRAVMLVTQLAGRPLPN